jgi:hypothetical protein
MFADRHSQMLRADPEHGDNEGEGELWSLGNTKAGLTG